MYYICIMIVEKGININDSTGQWSDMLLTGVKTIETRNQNNLKSFVGKPIGVVQTGVGKAKVVGFIILGDPIEYKTKFAFRQDSKKHCVKPNSQFDWNGVKFGYPVTVIKKLNKPIPVTSRGYVSRKIQPYEIY